jgi:hypothetical protein
VDVSAYGPNTADSQRWPVRECGEEAPDQGEGGAREPEEEPKMTTRQIDASENQIEMIPPTMVVYTGSHDQGEPVVRTNRIKKMQKAMLDAARAVKDEHPEIAKQLRAAQRPGQIGGVKPGAGRPTMFPGKRAKKMTIILTELAKGLVDAERQRLEPTFGKKANDSAAIERLIRKATKTRMDV